MPLRRRLPVQDARSVFSAMPNSLRIYLGRATFPKMDVTRLFLRMAYWLRHPPALWQVVVILIVLAASVGLFAIERTVGWPEWVKTERIRAPALQ